MLSNVFFTPHDYYISRVTHYLKKKAIIPWFELFSTKCYDAWNRTYVETKSDGYSGEKFIKMNLTLVLATILESKHTFQFYREDASSFQGYHSKWNRKHKRGFCGLCGGASREYNYYLSSKKLPVILLLLLFTNDWKAREEKLEQKLLLGFFHFKSNNTCWSCYILRVLQCFSAQHNLMRSTHIHILLTLVET